MATSHPHEETGHSVLQTVIIGCLVALVLIGAETVFAHSEMGKLVEQSTYSWLHHRLRFQMKTLPITVIDISGIEPEAATNGLSEERHKPRKALRELLHAVADRYPKAIGLDLEFSPRADYTLQTADDPEFFADCERIKQSHKIPIYLAVARGAPAVSSAGWLGLPQFADLAANAEVEKEAVSLPLWTQAKAANGGTPPAKLFSLSNRLAAAYKEDSTPTVPSLLAPFIEAIHEDTESDYSVGDYRVDYSALSQLRERNTIRVKTPADLDEHDAALRCGIVLIGNGNFEELPSDSFKVPGQDELVPGVYVHASGVYTLLTGPLYSFTAPGRTLLDVVFSILVIGSVAVLSSHFHAVGARRFQLLITFCASLLVLFAGGLLVTAMRLFWEDFIVVALALWVHPLVEDEILEFGGWIGSAVRRKPKASKAAGGHSKGGGHSQ